MRFLRRDRSDKGQIFKKCSYRARGSDKLFFWAFRQTAAHVSGKDISAHITGIFVPLPIIYKPGSRLRRGSTLTRAFFFVRNRNQNEISDKSSGARKRSKRISSGANGSRKVKFSQYLHTAGSFKTCYFVWRFAKRTRMYAEKT